MPFISASRHAIMLPASIAVLSGYASQRKPVYVASTTVATNEVVHTGKAF